MEFSPPMVQAILPKILLLVVILGLFYFFFKSISSRHQGERSSSVLWVLLFLVGVALAFLWAAGSGVTMPMRILPGVVLLLLVLLLVMVFAKKEGRGRRVGMFVLFMAVLLMVLAGLFMFRYRAYEVSPLHEFETINNRPFNDAGALPAIWSEGMEDDFKADIYPSKVAAIRALGVQLVEKLRKIRPSIIENEKPVVVQLAQSGESWQFINNLGAMIEKKINLDQKTLDQLSEVIRLGQRYITQSDRLLTVKLVQERHDRYLMEELRDVIIEGLDDCRCIIVSRAWEVETDQGEIGITLELLEESDAEIVTSWSLDTPSGEVTYAYEKPGKSPGKIEGRIFGANYDGRAMEVLFHEKPWVENFANFVNRYAERQWLWARSTDTCFSVEEARQLSLQDAANRVSNFLNGLKIRSKFDLSRIKISPVDILEGGFVVDQFAQSFKASEGMVWRQALLLDVSEGKLDDLMYKKTAALAKQRLSGAFLVISFLGMVGIICGLYALANAATKGYYSTVLRFFTVALVLAVVAGLVLALGLVRMQL